MGFSREAVCTALERTAGDMAAALEVLLSQTETVSGVGVAGPPTLMAQSPPSDATPQPQPQPQLPAAAAVASLSAPLAGGVPTVAGEPITSVPMGLPVVIPTATHAAPVQLPRGVRDATATASTAGREAALREAAVTSRQRTEAENALHREREEAAAALRQARAGWRRT